MFQNTKCSIEEDKLKEILGKNYENYVEKMMTNNLIDFYLYNNKKEFVFKIQRLSDFIIARPLQKKLDNLSTEEIIKEIDEKLSGLYSLSEAFIILVFDRYKYKDMNKVFDIISKSKLREEFEISHLRKIRLTQEQIDIIQKRLKVQDYEDIFLELGGYPNRAFNCSSYLNEKIIENKTYITGIFGKFNEGTHIIKLKNMLYSVIFIEEDNSYIKEYFWYAFWLMSVSNVRIRKLAIKVVFSIVDKFSNYSKVLKEYYNKINEYYIKNGIIRVLTSLVDRSQESIDFLNGILDDQEEIDSETIYRIANYLNKKDQYILLNKKNEYENVNVIDKIDKNINLKHILFIADIYERDSLKFEKYGKSDEISLYKDFILNDKKEILQWNRELQVKFACVYKNGYCKYSIGSDSFSKNMRKLDIIKIDKKRLFLTFQKIFIKVAEMYSYNYCEEIEKFDEHLNKFSDSLLKKVLFISQNLLIGSLMCNYYTDDFSVLNDDETFGYSLYQPIELNEEDFYIVSPVSLYCEDIDRLDNSIQKTIDIYGDRDYKWYKNSELSKENIKKLVNPIKHNGSEWSLIYADIHIYVSNENTKHKYTETYDFRIAINPHCDLVGDVNSSKLTIEDEKYIGNIKQYNQTNFYKCTKVPTIEYSSLDFKETHMKLPPTILITEFDLLYNPKYSTWDSKNGETIIYCDNNKKEYYNTPITGSIYIRTDYLKKVIEKYDVKYWAYIEKNYLDYGWNKNAQLHIELNEKGNIVKEFNNNSLKNKKEYIKDECKKCKYGIYQERSKPIDFSKIIMDFEEY